VSFKYVKWIILAHITKRVVIQNIFMKKLICWPIIVRIGLFQ